MLENNVREKQHGAYYNLVQQRLAPFRHSVESLAALATEYTADLPALRLLEGFPDIGFGCGGRSIPIEMIERAHTEGVSQLLGANSKLRRPSGLHQTGATPPGPIPPNLLHPGYNPLVFSIPGATCRVFDVPSAHHQPLSQARSLGSTSNEATDSQFTPEPEFLPTPSAKPTAKPTCSRMPTASGPCIQSTQEERTANVEPFKSKPSLIVTLRLPRHSGVLKNLEKVDTLRTNPKLTDTNWEFHMKRNEARALQSGWIAVPGDSWNVASANNFLSAQANPHTSGFIPIEHPAEAEEDGLPGRSPPRESQASAQPLSATTAPLGHRGSARRTATATLLTSAVDALRKSSTTESTTVTSRSLRSRSGKRATVGRGPFTVSPPGFVGWKT